MTEPEPDPELVEPEDAGDHDVPAGLVELHEILEWQAAAETGSDGDGGGG